MAENTNTGQTIYTEEEQKNLEKTQDIRIRLMDALTKDGVPTDVGTVRVLNEVLEKSDNAIHKTAEIRVKAADNANKEAIVETVAEMIRATKRQELERARNTEVEEIPTELIPTDFVEGETEIQPEPLSQEEIMNGAK